MEQEHAHGVWLRRRTALALGAAAAANPLLPRAAHAASVVRQSVTGPNFPAATLASYQRAISAMLALPPTDPRNWYRQAITHQIDCPHHNFWFLPWHRAYLYRLEAICRELSGDAAFALPFWDWTATPRIPNSLWDGVLDPGNSAYLADADAFQTRFGDAVTAFWSGLDSDQRAWMQRRSYGSADDLLNDVLQSFATRAQARSLTRQDPDLQNAVPAVALRSIEQILGISDFEDFGSAPADSHDGGETEGALESQPHDQVHGDINGFMGAFMSPIDPIFWLHHCNIDRLWTVWVARQTAAGLNPLPPNPDAWRNESFAFFVDQAGKPVTMKASDVLATPDLGYTYEPASGSEAASQPLVASLLPTPRVFAATRVGNTLTAANPSVSSIPLPRAVLQSTSPGQVIAQVTLAPPPDSRDVHFLVFVNAPDATISTPATDPHFAGGITPFGLHHHRGPVTFSIPIGATLARLASLGQLPGDGINIHVVAIRGATASALPPPAALAPNVNPLAGTVRAVQIKVR